MHAIVILLACIVGLGYRATSIVDETVHEFRDICSLLQRICLVTTLDLIWLVMIRYIAPGSVVVFDASRYVVHEYPPRVTKTFGPPHVGS